MQMRNSKYNGIFEHLFKTAVEMLRGGIIYILTGSVLVNAVSMISSIVIARLVDKSAYAALTYADNFYSYIALASGLGLSSAMLKFASSCDSVKEKSKYFNYSFVCGGIFNLCLSMALCLVVTFVKLPFDDAKSYIYLLVLYPMLQNFLNTVLSYFRVSLRNKEYAVLGIMQSIVVCALSILFVVLIGTVGIIPARYVAILTAITIGFLIIIRKEKICFREKLRAKERKELLTMGISLMFANLFSGMMPINESFLINNVLRDEVITANFKVAGFVPSQVYLITNAIAVYFFPLISKLECSTDIKKNFYKAGIINFILVVACTLFGIMLTPFLIRFLYGAKYEDAIPMSYIMWCIRGLNAGIRMIPMNLLPAVGKTRFNAILAMISMIVQFGLDFVFISLYGIRGIIYGAAVVYLITGIAYWAYFIYISKRM